MSFNNKVNRLTSDFNEKAKILFIEECKNYLLNSKYNSFSIQIRKNCYDDQYYYDSVGLHSIELKEYELKKSQEKSREILKQKDYIKEELDFNKKYRAKVSDLDWKQLEQLRKEIGKDYYYNFSYSERDKIVDTYELKLVRDDEKYKELERFIESGYSRDSLEDEFYWEDYKNELNVDTEDLYSFIDSFEPSLLVSIFIGKKGKEDYSEDSLVVELK